MRKSFLAARAVALMLGALTLVPVQSAAVVNLCHCGANPQIAALLAEYPDGGPGLRAAIAGAVEADATLATAVVAASCVANAAQKMAMGAGLGDAASFFAKIGSNLPGNLEGVIRAELVCADPVMLTAYVSATSPPGTGNGNPGNITNSNVGPTCISPSTPGHGC